MAARPALLGLLTAIVTACSSGATRDDDDDTGATTATATDRPDVASLDTSAGTAPADDIAFTGTFDRDLAGYGEFILSLSGSARRVGAYVPATRASHAPLVLAFHGTGANPSDFLDEAGLRALADQTGAIVVAPQAVERNGGQGEPGDPDHYAGSEGFYGTSWHLASDDPATNDDVRLVRAAIQAARDAWGVDSDHVYALGHSNGGFFAYHVAVLLRDRVAAFAENAAGAVRCPNRGPDGAQFTGAGTSCAALAASAGYPACSGALEPVSPGARPPWGLLAHHNDDDVVSVAWTCTLAEALADHATVFVKSPDDESHGHSVVTGFAERAWAVFVQHTRGD